MSETLTRSDFDARLNDRALSLTLVGMSNVGKSYWSRQLEEQAGFDRVSIDEHIEAKLSPLLQAQGFGSGIDAVARWMGQPYDPQFQDSQRTYLDLETEMQRRAVDLLANNPDENIVVDTTGSVVHTDKAIRRQLRLYSTVVYLEATPAMQQEMFELYKREPKPVVWGDVYTRQPGETPEQALASSYPKLLEHRRELYEKMAHVVITRAVLLSLKSTDEFLEHVKKELPTAYANSTSYIPQRG